MKHIQNFKANTTLIIILIIAVVILALIALVGVGTAIYFWQKNKTPESVIMTSTPTPIPTEKETSPTPIQESPKQVVENFLNYTLGTLPTAKLNYTAARALLTADLNDQYSDDSSFVPFFYGIQEGPDSVKFISENISGDSATVRYDASWGEMAMAWAFILTKSNNQWLISQFRNDAQ